MNIENKINIIEEEINSLHEEIKNLCASEKFTKSLKILISNFTVYMDVNCDSYYHSEYSGPLINCKYIISNYLNIKDISIETITMFQVNMRQTISFIHKNISLKSLDSKIYKYENELLDYKKSFFLIRNFMYNQKESENNLNYYKKIKNEHNENILTKDDVIIDIYKFINLISSLKPLMVKLNKEKLNFEKKINKRKKYIIKTK